LILVEDEINLLVLPLLVGASMPRQHSGQQRLTTHHKGGKRHERYGTKRPTFEERIRRPSVEDAESAADDGPQRSPRNGAPEDGVYDSRDLIEAGFLASFGFCSMKYLL
jgi:hypothetical protein